MLQFLFFSPNYKESEEERHHIYTVHSDAASSGRVLPEALGVKALRRVTSSEQVLLVSCSLSFTS